VSYDLPNRAFRAYVVASLCSFHLVDPSSTFKISMFNFNKIEQNEQRSDMFPFCMPVDLNTRMPYVYMFVSNFFGQVIPCIMHASDTVNPTCYNCPICYEDTEDFWDATIFQDQLDNQDKYNTVSYTASEDGTHTYLSECCTHGHTQCNSCDDNSKRYEQEQYQLLTEYEKRDWEPIVCPSCREPLISLDQRRTIPLFVKTAAQKRILDRQNIQFSELHGTIDKADGSGTLLKKKKLADEQALARMTPSSQQALTRLTTQNIFLPMHTVQQQDNALQAAQLDTARLTIESLLVQAPPARQSYTDMLFAKIPSTAETSLTREGLEERQAARAHRTSLLPPEERTQLDKILQDELQLDFEIAIRQKSLDRAQNARPDYQLILDQHDPNWRRRIRRGHILGLPPA